MGGRWPRRWSGTRRPWSTACPGSTSKGRAKRTGTSIAEGYGLSETGAASHLNPLGRAKPGSFGCPVPSVLAAVVSTEGGTASHEFVAPGATGELVLSGPSVMQGYWQKP